MCCLLDSSIASQERELFCLKDSRSKINLWGKAHKSTKIQGLLLCRPSIQTIAFFWAGRCVWWVVGIRLTGEILAKKIVSKLEWPSGGEALILLPMQHLKSETIFVAVAERASGSHLNPRHEFMNQKHFSVCSKRSSTCLGRVCDQSCLWAEPAMRAVSLQRN